MSVRNTRLNQLNGGFVVVWHGREKEEENISKYECQKHPMKLNLQTSLRTFKNPSASSLLFVPNSFFL